MNLKIILITGIMIITNSANANEFKISTKIKELKPLNDNKTEFTILPSGEKIFPKSNLLEQNKFKGEIIGNRSKKLDFALPLHSKGANDSFKIKKNYKVNVPENLKPYFPEQ